MKAAPHIDRQVNVAGWDLAVTCTGGARIRGRPRAREGIVVLEVPAGMPIEWQDHRR